jgi:hypothetical protein
MQENAYLRNGIDPAIKRLITEILVEKRHIPAFEADKISNELLVRSLTADKLPKKRQIQNFKYNLERRNEDDY